MMMVPPSEPDDTPPGDPPSFVHRSPSQITTGKVVQGRFDLNDIGLIESEIIQNLRADGGDVTISITISATKPGGFSEGIARSVRENSVQLGLDYEQNEE